MKKKGNLRRTFGCSTTQLGSKNRMPEPKKEIRWNRREPERNKQKRWATMLMKLLRTQN